MWEKREINLTVRKFTAMKKHKVFRRGFDLFY